MPRAAASTRPRSCWWRRFGHSRCTVASSSTPSKTSNPAAVERGLENLAAHLDSAAHFGKPTVVAINQFGSDTPEEIKVVHDYCAGRGVPCATADVFGSGGGGAIDLAEKVVAAAAQPETPLKPLYPLDWPAERKIKQIARIMYGAADVNILPAAAAKIKKANKLGYGKLPICMAKTQDSLSDNPKLRGRPQGFHADGPRHRDRRRGRLPGRSHRRDRPHAGPARTARRGTNRRRSGGPDRGVVLMTRGRGLVADRDSASAEC